jgi:S1-C subfamily serine protease
VNKLLTAAAMVLTLLLGVGFTGLPFAHAPDNPALSPVANLVADEVVAPYWEVRETPDTFNGSGVAVRVAEETLILTASHVVADSGFLGRSIPYSKVYLFKEGKGSQQRLLAHVVALGNQDGVDLALLRPDDSTTLQPAQALIVDPVRVGEDCWYIGTGGGVHQRLERSIVSRVDWFDRDQQWTQVNGNGWFGNSGGPLFVVRNGHYRLAGIVVRMWASDPKAPMLVENPARIRAFIQKYIDQKKVDNER